MWEEDRDIILAKHFEIINMNNLRLFGILKDHIPEVQPILPLIEFIISRVETVTSLLLNEKLWDAEIVLRSATETLMKLLFITSTKDEAERNNRIEEYWNSLADINSLKMSEQAKKNLRYFGDSELHRVAYSPLILSEEREEELRNKWTKNKRRILEQKWSFSGMINNMSKECKNTPLEMISTLTHGYRMSSHVIHGDETGVHIIIERERRAPEEYNKAHRGHYLRLISDCCSFCTLMASEVMGFIDFQNERKDFLESLKELKEIEELISKYSGRVFEDEDYDKYRS